MKRVRIFLIICLILQLLISASCARTPSPYEFDYPRGISPLYCFENYKLFDPNVRYTECCEFVVPWNKTERKTTGMFGTGSINYSAIKGVDDLSFMVCHKNIPWFGENIDVYVVRHDASDVQPITDFTVSRIVLCTSTAMHYDINDIETYYNNAEYSVSEPIVTIESPELKDAILSVARRPAVMNDEEVKRVREEYQSGYDPRLQNIVLRGEYLYVMIYFEECEGLVWGGKLLTDKDGRVYLERCCYKCESESELKIRTDFGGPYATEFYYPLGEEMDGIVRDITSG